MNFITPIIRSQTIIPETFVESPVYVQTYDVPLMKLVNYPDLNYDMELRGKVTKYFLYKTLDKYLYNELKSILNYLTYENGKISLIKSIQDYKINNEDSEEIKEKKINWLENQKYFTKSDMYNVLSHLYTDYKINWYDMYHQKKIIISAIKKYLVKMFEKLISKK